MTDARVSLLLQTQGQMLHFVMADGGMDTSEDENAQVHPGA